MFGAAPHDEPDARIGQAVLVAADVDRDHPRQPKVPSHLGVQEWHHEAAAGRVDVHRHVHSTVGGQLVEGRAYLGNRFELTGVGGAKDGDHADGVFVDHAEHLLGRYDVTALLHREVDGLDVEVAAELLPDHLDVGTHHQVRGALAPVLTHTLTPPPA